LRLHHERKFVNNVALNTGPTKTAVIQQILAYDVYGAIALVSVIK